MIAARHVVITQKFFDDDTLAYLQSQNCSVTIAQLPAGKNEGTLTPADIATLLDGAAGWIVGHANITREVLGLLPHLQIVSRRGVGYERIDLQAIKDTGKIAVIGVGGNDTSVADHTVGLMLAVGRRMREMQANMVAGNWAILPSRDLTGKTVGIVGFGRIGRSVAQRLSGFGCRLLVHTDAASRDSALAHQVEYVELDKLTLESDYITVHAPLLPETMFLFNAERISIMNQSAILINAARGGLVEDRDLLAALKAGKLAGAGLDTFVSESDASYKPVTDELITLPNVVATPHAAASSWEALKRTNRIAAESIVAVLDGYTPPPERIVADGRSAAGHSA